MAFVSSSCCNNDTLEQKHVFSDCLIVTTHPNPLRGMFIANTSKKICQCQRILTMKLTNSAFFKFFIMLTIKLAGCSFAAGEGIIEEVFPAHGSSGVDTDTCITLRTNIPIDSFSVKKKGGLIVTTASGDAIQGEIVTDSTGTQITFVPRNAFPKDERFLICLQPSFRTSSGTRFSAYRVDPDLTFLDAIQNGDCFQFSTKPELSVRRAFSEPHHGEIRVYFSREPDLESIKEADIIWKQNQITGPVSMRYNPTKNMLIIYPAGNVDLNRPLTLIFPESLTATDGVALKHTAIDVFPIDS